MKRVVHVGPSESQGGMSEVMKQLKENPPEGWTSSLVNSHSEHGIIRKIIAWRRAKRDILQLIKERGVNLAHVHVTHSMSWWRKRNLMRVFSKHDIPIIVHIHSGKFQDFCRSFAGRSVRHELSKDNRKTVVLEDRWLEELVEWIPDDSMVVPNFVVRKRAVINKSKIGNPIVLLLLSRADKIKGRDLAIRVVEELNSRGVESKLRVTGSLPDKGGGNGFLEELGWVEEDEKIELMSDADFLLSPSLYEGSSMTVIEGIVHGIPCICSKASEETIGVSSLVVDSSDPNEWADRIESLISEEKYQYVREEIAKRSKHFDRNKIVHLWGEIYSGMVSRSMEK